MADHRPRSSYESDALPYTKAAAHRAVRITIGQELSARYEVPPDLPHEMLTLLLQLNEHDEERLLSMMSALPAPLDRTEERACNMPIIP